MDRIGRYFPIALLGRGGMAQVYLCVAPGAAATRKLLVVKQVRSELAADPKIIEMFLNEARLATVLNHPNVVQTYEIIAVDGNYYIVMEYIEGQSLSALMKRGCAGGVSLEARLAIVIEALAGLHYAHESHDLDGRPLAIVHRDVSPQNIVVSYEGHAKLMDFGIAKVNSSTNDTATGHFRGKVGYAAPEQVRGSRVDRRTDIFAMGIVLYELATGARFWSGAADIEIMNSLSTDKVPRATASSPEIGPALARIVEKATTARREERYGTAVELATDLEALLGSRSRTACARELAQFLQRAFEVERRDIRATIEAQLKTLPPGEESGPAPSSPPTSQPVPRHAVSDAEVSGPSIARVARDTSAPSARPSSAKPYAIGLLACAVLAGAGMTAYRTKRMSPAPTNAAPDPARATALTRLAPESPTDAAPGTDAEGTIQVTLSASPPTSQLFLDGKPLPSNPAHVTARSDDALHEVRASDPAYTTASRVVRFAPDQNIDLVLTPAPRQAAPPRATPPARGAERSPSHPDLPPTLPTPAPRATGAIEEKDPYR